MDLDLGVEIDADQGVVGVSMIVAREEEVSDAKVGADSAGDLLEEVGASDREGVVIDHMVDLVPGLDPTNVVKTLAHQELAGAEVARDTEAQAPAVPMTVQEAHKAAADSKLKKCFLSFSI